MQGGLSKAHLQNFLVNLAHAGVRF